MLPINLTNAARNGKLVPIVGAGVSKSLKKKDGTPAYPNWVEVLENAAESLEKNGKIKESAGIRGILPLGLYQQAADIAKSAFLGGDWGTFLEESFDLKPALLDESSMDLPKALWSISKNIITLNFDKVLRYASPDQSLVEFDNTQGAQLANFVKLKEDKYHLWHMHGRIDNYASIIFTSASYSSLYSSNSDFKGALRAFGQICTSSTLLFVGCSLSDAELLQQISETAQSFQNNVGPHYALVHKNELTSVKQKLKGLPIEVICFDDFGPPLLSIIKQITPKIVKDFSEPPENSKSIKSTFSKINRIAYLVANPIDRRHAGTNLEKELKKLKFETHFLPLNLETLNSLHDFDYIFISSGVLRNKFVIEDEWMAYQRVDLFEIIDNISPIGISGLFLFTDSNDTQSISLENCSGTEIPIAIYPSLDKGLQNSIAFKLFSKKTVELGNDTIILNKEKFNLTISGSCYEEVRMRSLLTENIDPRSINGFVGRVDDLKNICKKVLDSRNVGEFVSIKGAGGIGKTMLAKASAIEFSNRYLFSKGIFFIDCEFISDFDTFERQIARVFEFEQSDELRAKIKKHRVNIDQLIILDNAESLLSLESNNQVKDLIAFIAEYCAIIITTRELLRIDAEASFEVRQLTTDEAYELFTQQLGSREIHEKEKGFVREKIIEDLLDNNPLAIKLITRNMPKGKDFKVLRDELMEDVFGKVCEEDSQIFSNEADQNIERRRSIYASINYSYANLSEKERAAFDALSLFPSGINMEAFKRVCENTKSTKRRDIKSENNPANQFIITDSLIKSLESKSVIEIDNNNVCLQSLVGRFAEHQFNKRTPSEIKRFRKSSFHYKRSFAQALMRLDSDEAYLRNKLFWNYQKNFIKAVYYSNSIDESTESICDFLLDISSLCVSTCTYSSLINALDSTDFSFEKGSIYDRCVRIVYLSQKYFYGEFEKSFTETKIEFPLEKLREFDSNDILVRNVIGSALNIYGMNGHLLDILPLMPAYVRTYDPYPDILFELGEFDTELIVSSKDHFFTFEAKLAIGILTQSNIDSYIKALHKQEHLERMQATYTRAKLCGISSVETERLVVVNPYTEGIKNLILGITAGTSESARTNFESAIKCLFNIKYYYVEAHYQYANYLFNIGDFSLSNKIKCEGLKLGIRHGYRYLCHLLSQIGENTLETYDSKKYELSSEALLAIKEVIAQQRKKKGLSQLN